LRAADPKPPSSVPLVIPLDLFALFRLRSTGGKLLSDIRPIWYDAVQHPNGQLLRGQFPCRPELE
jgi:hypothetical protein